MLAELNTRPHAMTTADTFRFPRWLASRIVDPLDQLLNLSSFLSMFTNFSALNSYNFFRIWLFLTLRLILSLFNAWFFVWLFIFWGCGDSVASMATGFKSMSLEIASAEIAQSFGKSDSWTYDSAGSSKSLLIVLILHFLPARFNSL